jgi:hypothetical protein
MPVNSITCIPEEVTLTCSNAQSMTTVRIRVDPAAVTDVSALGYDPAVASLDPSGGKTNDKGVLDIVVKCVDKGPCPASTTVTFEADGETSELKISCTDYTKAAIMDAVAEGAGDRPVESALVQGRLVVEPLPIEGRLVFVPVKTARGGPRDA